MSTEGVSGLVPPNRMKLCALTPSLSWSISRSPTPMTVYARRNRNDRREDTWRTNRTYLYDIRKDIETVHLLGNDNEFNVHECYYSTSRRNENK